jgi:hypothetical protein
MANALYDKGREKFLTGALSWSSDTIKAALVDTALYAVNLAADEFLSAIASGARVATSSAFTSKTTAAGVADAADLLFAAVTGASCEALVLYKDTGSDTTSPLIAYIDTATGLPVTPSGSDIPVIWDNGANKIFKL